MSWRELCDRVVSAGIELPAGYDSRPILHIDSSRQLLTCNFTSPAAPQLFPVSTSRYGSGQQKDSYQTPLGIHSIAQKIGDNEPPGRVFRAREAIDQICLNPADNAEQDVITTRILWLEGMQPGFNQGGDVDSKQRYIYIHGTSDEAHIGQPASIGCIRMKNRDVITLYDRVETGDLVVIE